MRSVLANKLYWYCLTPCMSVAILMLTSLSSFAEEGTSDEDPSGGNSDTGEHGEESSEDGDPDSEHSESAAQGTEDPAPEPPTAQAPLPAATAKATLAPPPPPARPTPPTAGYKRGFFIASPDGAFKVAINGRIQARFTYENIDGDSREHKAQFSIPRARLKLRGHAFQERVAFALSIDFGKGGVSLKDALVDFNLVDRKLMVQVGQFKRPFSRQQLTSSSEQQFVDRAITDQYFNGGRDLGVMLHSHNKLPFEYAVGLFNGSGDKGLLDAKVSAGTDTGKGEDTSGKFSNVPELMDPMVVARVGWHSEGFNGYTESDYKGGDFGVGIGGGVVLDFDSNDDDDSAIRAGIDYALAARGLSSTGGVYVATAQDGKGFGDQGFDAVGFHVQAGYVIKGRVEPAIRYARLMPIGGDGATQELLGAVNVFFHGHNVKWSTDFGVLAAKKGGESSVDFRARSQVQLSF